MGGRGKPATDHPDGSADGEMGRAAEGKKRYAAQTACCLKDPTASPAACGVDRNDLSHFAIFSRRPAPVSCSVPGGQPFGGWLSMRTNKSQTTAVYHANCCSSYQCREYTFHQLDPRHNASVDLCTACIYGNNDASRTPQWPRERTSATATPVKSRTPVQSPT